MPLAGSRGGTPWALPPECRGGVPALSTSHCTGEADEVVEGEAFAADVDGEAARRDALRGTLFRDAEGGGEVVDESLAAHGEGGAHELAHEFFVRAVQPAGDAVETHHRAVHIGCGADACRRVAESLGAEFRVRPAITADEEY